jgi:hypothetical protein
MLRKTTRRLDPEYAQEIGLSALTFMTEDRERLVRFLELTGMTPSELRTQAQSASLLGAVLDHLLADESLLLVFTASAGLQPEILAPARELLRPAR